MKTAKAYLFCGLVIGVLLLCIWMINQPYPWHDVARNLQRSPRFSTKKECDNDVRERTLQNKSVSAGTPKLAGNAKGNNNVTVKRNDKEKPLNFTKTSEAQSATIHTRGYREIMDNCKSECINSGGTQIPKLVYFIKTDPEWRFYEWVAVLSVHKYIKPDKIYIVSDVQLNPNCWWNRTVSIPKVRYVVLPKDQWLRGIRGRKFTEKAHVCDYMKPLLLYEMGGIYMDTDAIAIKSFDSLLTHQVVLARDQGGFVVNGLMVAQKHSCFICEFMRRSYRNFNGVWNQHSTYTLNPMAANTRNYKDVVILKQYDGFFPFSPNKIRYEKFLINDTNLLSHDMTKLYAIHLYHSAITTQEDYVIIKNMTIDTYLWLNSSKSYGAKVFRSIIPNGFSEKHRYTTKVCEPLPDYA